MLPEEIIDKLQILPVESLRTHEEVIPFNLQRLKEGMLNMGRLVDPLVVDGKHLVVLDGNHRKKVLESIKCPNAACQIVDYESDEIRVGSWFPVTKTLKPGEIPGFAPENVDFDSGAAAIRKMNATFMYVREKNGKRECYLYDSAEQSVRSVVEQQRNFLRQLEGRDVQYVPDDKIDEYVSQGYAAFFRRAYTKQEIVSEAVAGRQMPPKSTRHIIPDRIIRLNLHLGWLSESPEVAKQMMDASLRRRLGESSIRRYVEPVIVLY